MAQINIPGTSVVYSNPRSLDATIPDPKTNLPWEPWPSAPGTTSWGGRLTYSGPSTPQPQTYQAGSPNVPQPVFNQAAPSPSPISAVKNADGSTVSANGLVPNSSVVFRNPS